MASCTSRSCMATTSTVPAPFWWDSAGNARTCRSKFNNLSRSCTRTSNGDGAATPWAFFFGSTTDASWTYR